MLPERKEIVKIVRYLPKEKLVHLLKYAEELEEELTPEEMSDLKAAKAEVARGEWVSFDEIRQSEGL